MTTTLSDSYKLFGQRLQGCIECDLCELPVNQPDGAKILGTGDPSSQVFFVAQNPSIFRTKGARVLDRGDRAGRLFCEAFRTKGVRRESMIVTHLVKCSTAKNEIPSDATVETCAKTWLENEIALLDPKIIVTVGRLPMHYFGAAEHQEIDWRGRRVLAIKHPAYYVKQEWTHLDYADQELEKLVDAGVFDLLTKEK